MEKNKKTLEIFKQRNSPSVLVDFITLFAYIDFCTKDHIYAKSARKSLIQLQILEIFYKNVLILIKSSKGEDQFISNNQIFGKHRKTKSNRVWRCILQLCPSTALRFLEYTEESSDFVLIKQHNHLEPGILCRKRIIITKMKILILKSGLPPFQAVYSILGGAAYEIIGDLVPLSNIYRMLRDYK